MKFFCKPFIKLKLFKNKFSIYKINKLHQFTYIPLSLLPNLSNGGDKKAIPIKFGITAITNPETPLFAGIPTLQAQFPE